MSGNCYRCGGELHPLEPVSRNELCPKCGNYARCCKNCYFHDEGYHNQCREPQSEPVSDREMGNFCDFFRLASGKKPGASSAGADDARRRFDSLFAKKSG